MPASLHEVLSAQVTTRVVSREAGANHYLLRLFGMNPGGAGEVKVGHRHFGYDIFNDTRTVGQGRLPGVAAGTATRQSVGRVQGVFPRMFEKLPLLAEELHNFRAIGGASNAFDSRGVQYTLRQQRYMGQRAGNFRALLLAGMMRGKLYAHRSGDTIYYDFDSTNAAWEIDWKTPASHQSLITATWATETNDVPAMLNNINAHLQKTVGTSLGTIICPVNVWQAVINNDYVQALAGVSNPPFSVQERVPGVANNGMAQTVIRGRITAVPWIDWIITNEGLRVGPPGNETFQQFIPDGHIWFGPQLGTDVGTYFEMLLGSEPVSEGYGAPEVERFGLYAWTKEVDDPTGRILYTLDNAIPANYIPASNGMVQVIL
ncbi:MAG: major capsid protein [Candidatus Bilamarchaeaceae archaeon]